MKASQAVMISRFSASSGATGRSARDVRIHCFFRFIAPFRVR